MAVYGAYLQQGSQTTISLSSTTTTKQSVSCVKCSKIVNRGVEFKNSIWHRECFICTNCPESLAGAKFVSEGGKPYCFRCFGALFAHKCDACQTPIYSVGDGFLIRMAGRHWHVSCFRCQECETHLLGELSIFKKTRLCCIGCDKKKSS